MSKKSASSKNNLMPGFVLGLAILSLCLLLTKVQGNESEAAARPAVRLNEVMTKNVYTLTDDYADTSDWVELVNDSAEPVNLKDWMLMGSKDAASAFVFGDETLLPGETLLVFASGRFQNRPGYVHHASFKLSASGDTVSLYDPSGALADRVDVPSMDADSSYARAGDIWEISLFPTPGCPNDAAVETASAQTAVETLRLNELMPDNATYRLDDGCLCDYVELYNDSAIPMTLDGYTLTDDETNPGKYALDGLSIGGYGCLLIHLDGIGDLPGHAPFGLNADGEQLLLYNPQGSLIDKIDFETVNADQALSRTAGGWSLLLSPTPGLTNTADNAAYISSLFEAANQSGLFINEVCFSNTEDVDGHNSYDWIEIRNAGTNTVDLTGFGLSDDPGKPRKWQFPEGVSIKSGGYLVVMVSGNEIAEKDRYGFYQADFSLSAGESVTLCMPNGTVLDRVPVMPQYGDISCGRMDNQSGFFYFETPTIGAYNGADGLRTRCAKPVFTTKGGLFDEGDSVTVEITADPDALIFYTLDCSDPDTSSMVYNGPFTVNSTTVVRAIAVRQNSVSSYVATETYFFGLNHGLRVVSLVTDNDNLYSKSTGILTNELKSWERAANVEIYNADGTVVQSSHGCGLALNGDASRRLDMKSFRVLGRSCYDENNSFSSGLFTNRDYENYRSFLLRGGGQDNTRALIRDPYIDALADATEVYYQESELCVLYLNGSFYGVYDIRERISTYSISDFEGWERTKNIDLVKGNDLVQNGSNKDYTELLQWIKDNPNATDDNIAYLETRIDLDNYIDYMSFMILSANQDVGVRRYRSTDADGRWRWLVYDQDFGFYNDTDSISRWMDSKGAGAYQKVENKLFRYLMSNDGVVDRFLTRFGELIAGPWTADTLLARFDAIVDLVRPEMTMHCEKWSSVLTYKRWEQQISNMRARIAERPEKIIGYLCDYFKLTDAEKEKYFGAALN